jgi:O-antigen ligase
MRDKIIAVLRKTELTGFYLLLFFLPFLKVPKNLGIVLLILGGISWRLLDKSTKFRRPDVFEWLLISIVGIALISTVVNWPFPKGINGLNDTLKFAMIAFIAKNNFYSPRQIKIMLWLFVAGAAIGLAWGFVEWQSDLARRWEFRRMMVAETSIIVGIVVAALLGVLYADRSLFCKRERIIATVLIVAFLACMLFMGNRSGLLGFLVFFGLLVMSQFRKRISLIIVSLLGVTVVASLLVLSATGFKGTIEHLVSTQINIQSSSGDSFTVSDQFRFDYWSLGFEQARQGGSPIFGIGPRNFRSIDINALNFDSPLVNAYRLNDPVHAHNLYITKLAEEGIAGLLVLLGFLVYMLCLIFKFRPRGESVHWLWVACLGAIVIPFVAGIFYAPFRREVAWVTMVFAGLALNYFHNPGRHENPPRVSPQ